MSEWQRLRALSAGRALLDGWRRADALQPAAVAPARAALSLAMDAPLWRWLLDTLALWLGVALSAAAVIFFIAANWEALGTFARFAGAQALLIVFTVAAARLGLSRPAGQAALWLATVTLGGLLALIGQTYQTGADPWELFSIWALLALPWALAGRSAPLWLLWALVLNLALGLYLTQMHPGHWRHVSTAAWLAVLDLLLLLGWRAAGGRWPEFGGRNGPRLLAAAALGLLTMAGISTVVGYGVYSYAEKVRPLAQPDSWVWLVAVIGFATLELRGRRDLPILAMLALSAIIVTTLWLGEWLLGNVFSQKPPAVLWLLLALLVLAEATAAAIGLRRLARENAEADA